ncbi:MAG: phytoene desaturase, partial [Candidatus Omnitrophica bacterium]|nr:phytoene desaturase [Candidatus Omnitrophota bacterium]
NYNSEVRSISKNNGSISLEVNNSISEYDIAAVNADYAYTKTDLLKRNIPQYKYSCSVYLIYLGLKKKVRNLEHHNLFFARDLNKNLDLIFKTKFVPDDPSFYVHVPTVTDSSLAPVGKDILYLLIPVANLENSQEDLSKKEANLRKIVFERINQEIGEDLESLIEVEHRF